MVLDAPPAPDRLRTLAGRAAPGGLPQRRSVRALSIQGTFALISWVNGAVLTYLLLSFVQLIGEMRGRTSQIYVSLFLVCLLAILTIIANRIISTRIVRPLARLVQESRLIELDESDALLSVRSDDEVGRLAHGFNLLLGKMRSAARAIDEANGRLTEANAQISDSIRYAALLQRTILPDRQLQEVFGDNHFVLWQPRDTVGGDFYLLHRQGQRCLAGVADCAGHGVSGAMMTMLARAGVDLAIQEVGIDSPAALLASTDVALRRLLSDAHLSRGIATSMDMGLVLLDFEARQLCFAGAKLSMYCCDGESIRILRGDNRSLCERRSGRYQDQQLPLNPGMTYTLTTDGCLDQAGGDHGFSVGSDRFCEWLLQYARYPMVELCRGFTKSLAAFQGSHPRRDDITILSFRIP